MLNAIHAMLYLTPSLLPHRPLFIVVLIHCTADTPCPQYKANKHQTVHVQTLVKRFIPELFGTTCVWCP